MDEGIGRVLAALDEIGARENTLVVFSSDNGGERFSDSYPLIGKKMDLLEGGIRVPYIVRWPARGFPPVKTYDRLAIGMDWTATFLAAAGVSAHPDYPLDGIDLFGEQVERNLYWRMVYRNQKAVRSGVWKYLSIDGAEFLFDLSRDERERANMRYREPKKFEELRRAYFEWDASMPPRPEDAAVALEYTAADDGESPTADSRASLDWPAAEKARSREPSGKRPGAPRILRRSGMVRKRPASTRRLAARSRCSCAPTAAPSDARWLTNATSIANATLATLALNVPMRHQSSSTSAYFECITIRWYSQSSSPAAIHRR